MKVAIFVLASVAAVVAVVLLVVMIVAWFDPYTETFFGVF